MEPMTAFERKVVHDEVAAAGLVSESEGVEPHRHVVVLPAMTASFHVERTTAPSFQSTTVLP